MSNELASRLSKCSLPDEVTKDNKCRDSSSRTKTSRAARRREKRATERHNQEKAALKAVCGTPNSARSVELNQLNEKLSLRGFRLYEVPSDGDCLYLSVGHQLQLRHISTTHLNLTICDLRKQELVQCLRNLTAEHIRSNMDDFLPFLLNPETDDLMDTDAFNAYCDAISNTSAWGGQVELRALSNVLRISIEILQADSAPVVLGEEFGTQPITIIYHRHAYALGEHYNSCVPLS